jgi:hypothetical protein
MTREVIVLIRRAVLSAVVLVGAAVATFELTASADPSSPRGMPSDDAPSATVAPSAHALGPASSASSWPQLSHL